MEEIVAKPAAGRVVGEIWECAGEAGEHGLCNVFCIGELERAREAETDNGFSI